MLSPLISKTPVFKNNRKKYKPIRVSLFGLKSIEEIQAEVLLSLYPILKNRKIKIGASITKALIKGLMILKGYGEYDKLIAEVKIKKEEVFEFLDLNELVICFDDLERISDKLSIQEFIGYINSLIEDQNNKILIITNQDKIKDDHFLAIKEKVIGNSIEFNVNLEEVFDSIVEKKFDGEKAYQPFLKEEKQFILNQFSKGSKNLRTLSFCLKYYQRIYSEIELNLNSIPVLLKNKSEIISDILRFAIVISIEYQKGMITYKDKKGLKFMGFELFEPPAMNSKTDKTYRDEIKETYFDNLPYNFYDSVYNYITGGESFDCSKLLNQLKAKYNIKDDKIPLHYEVFNKLGYLQCYDLTDEEYLKLTNKLLEFIDKGLYDLSDFLTLFHYVTRFNNPLSLDIQELENRVITAMKNSESKFKYKPELDFYLSIGEDADFKNSLDKIKRDALEINENIRRKNAEDEGFELQELCYSNFDVFAEKILDKQGKYFYKPVLTDFDVARFLKYYIDNPPNRFSIIRFFSNRYQYSLTELKPERSFLRNLLLNVEELDQQQQGKNVTGDLIKKLKKYLINADHMLRLA